MNAFIPVKEMWIKVHHVQARRIRCGSCEKPFVCLVEGDAKVAVTGIPLVSSDEGMRADLARKAEKELRSLDGKRWRERGLCPHCRRYQPWMIRRSRWRLMPLWGLALFGAAIFPGSLVALLLPSTKAFAALRLGVLALSPFAGLYVGWRKALPDGVQQGREDPASISDDDFWSLLKHCQRSDREPVAEWFLSLHEAAPKGTVLVSMGCRDLLDEEFFPEKWRTEQVLAAF